MNELAVAQQQEMAIVPASGSLFFDVGLFEHAQRVANMLASSDMLPDHFKGNIGNCVIALNLANRMKCDPFMLMQNLYIVHGKPGIEAKLAIALVNASGKFTPIQYEFNEDKTSCVAHANRTGTGEVCRSVPVTLEMAKAEGWMSKNGSKWKTMPELMLQYRSAMFFARAYCPEALLGMQSREELHDTYDMTPGPGGYQLAKEDTTTDLQAKLDAKPSLREEYRREVDVPAAQNGKYADQMTAEDRDMGKAQDEQKPDPKPESDKNGNEQSFVEEWRNLRRAGYSTYYFTNEQKFKDSSPAVQERARKKWFSIYGDQAIFPLDQAPVLDHNGPDNEPQPESGFVDETETGNEATSQPAPQQKKDGPPSSWAHEPPPPKNTIIPGNESDAHLAAERDKPADKYEFHTRGQLAGMSMVLQQFYLEMATEFSTTSEAISPKAINSALKIKYPAQWQSAQEKLGFGGFPATVEAADKWNDLIAELVDGGMKV